MWGFHAPLAEPCEKLQARASLPSFLAAVSANVAAIMDGGSARGAQCFKAPLASCSFLYIIDTWFPGWEPPQASSKHPVPFLFLCKPQAESREHFPVSGSTSGSHRAHLRWKWVPPWEHWKQIPVLESAQASLCCVGSRSMFCRSDAQCCDNGSLDARPLPPHSFQDPAVFCLPCRTCSHHPTVSKTP